MNHAVFLVEFRGVIYLFLEVVFLRKCVLFLLAAALMVSLCSVAFGADTVKVGYIAALTGDWAAYGQTEQRTAQLAVDEINAKGGIKGLPVELVVYDFRGRQEDAVNAVRRLINEDKVLAIVGANSSGINIATAALVNSAGVPQIGTVSTNPAVTVDRKGKVRPYSFRVCFTDPYQGKLIAFFASQELEKKTAAILYDIASDYSQGLREFFMESFKEYGGEIVADEAFKGGQDVDFRAQLTKIREADPDVLVLPNMGKECALIIKQARELGMDRVVFIGGDGYGEFMWEIAGESLEGSYWINHVAKEDPAMAQFFADYKAKYNDECKEFVNGILGYDAMYLLFNAIERAENLDSESIAKALSASDGVQLHHAVITMDEFHNPKDKDGIVLICERGESRFFKKIKP